jgi:hypothetical protein
METYDHLIFGNQHMLRVAYADNVSSVALGAVVQTMSVSLIVYCRG